MRWRQRWRQRQYSDSDNTQSGNGPSQCIREKTYEVDVQHKAFYFDAGSRGGGGSGSGSDSGSDSGIGKGKAVGNASFFAAIQEDLGKMSAFKEEAIAFDEKRERRANADLRSMTMRRAKLMIDIFKRTGEISPNDFADMEKDDFKHHGITVGEDGTTLTSAKLGKGTVVGAKMGHGHWAFTVRWGRAKTADSKYTTFLVRATRGGQGRGQH